MRYVFASIIAILLSSCMDVGTTTKYNESLTSSRSQSGDITLSFTNNRGAIYYFILESRTIDGEPHDLLKVRWINPDRNHMQFNGMQSALKFIVNKDLIISLMPFKEPVLIGYNLDDKTREEEAIYKISRAQLKEIAYAKTVEVELSGSNKVVISRFNKWHSFKGFKKFLENS